MAAEEDARGRDLLEYLPPVIRAHLAQAAALSDEQRINLYLVGGVVRDFLLGKPNTDIDLAVETDGIRFAQDMGVMTGAMVHRHRRFGTAHLIFPDQSRIDIATARRERYEKPAALPTVEPGNILDDMSRRDFSINAMAISLNRDRFGALIDPFSGQDDLKNRRIRVLHDLSFIDDPTRMFRAVRLEKRLGFRLNSHTEALFCDAACAGWIDHLSGQRLFEQIRLTCGEPDPLPVFQRLEKLDALRWAHPELTVSEAVKRAFTAVKASDPGDEERKAMRWALFLLALTAQWPPEAIETFIRRLGPDRRLRRILRAAPPMKRIVQDIADGHIDGPAVFYRKASALPDATILFYSLTASDPAARSLCDWILDRDRHIQPVINGHALREMGIPEGAVYRRILETIQEERLSGKIGGEQAERQRARDLWNALKQER